MHITINFKLVFYNVYVCVFVLSHAQLFATPGTVAHSRLCRWNFPGKNTGVGCYSLLQGIYPTQGSNPGLPYCRQILYRLSHQGNSEGMKREKLLGQMLLRSLFQGKTSKKLVWLSLMSSWRISGCFFHGPSIRRWTPRHSFIF